MRLLPADEQRTQDYGYVGDSNCKEQKCLRTYITLRTSRNVHYVILCLQVLPGILFCFTLSGSVVTVSVITE